MTNRDRNIEYDDYFNIKYIKQEDELCYYEKHSSVVIDYVTTFSLFNTKLLIIILIKSSVLFILYIFNLIQIENLSIIRVITALIITNILLLCSLKLTSSINTQEKNFNLCYIIGFSLLISIFMQEILGSMFLVDITKEKFSSNEELEDAPLIKEHCLNLVYYINYWLGISSLVYSWIYSQEIKGWKLQSLIQISLIIKFFMQIDFETLSSKNIFETVIVIIVIIYNSIELEKYYRQVFYLNTLVINKISRYNNILDEMQQGVLILEDGKFSYINNFMLKIFKDDLIVPKNDNNSNIDNTYLQYKNLFINKNFLKDNKNISTDNKNISSDKNISADKTISADKNNLTPEKNLSSDLSNINNSQLSKDSIAPIYEEKINLLLSNVSRLNDNLPKSIINYYNENRTQKRSQVSVINYKKIEQFIKENKGFFKEFTWFGMVSFSNRKIDVAEKNNYYDFVNELISEYDLMIRYAQDPLLSTVYYIEFFMIDITRFNINTRKITVNQCKKDFLAKIAHEMRNPLCGIIELSDTISIELVKIFNINDNKTFNINDSKKPDALNNIGNNNFNNNNNNSQHFSSHFNNSPIYDNSISNSNHYNNNNMPCNLDNFRNSFGLIQLSTKHIMNICNLMSLVLQDFTLSCTFNEFCLKCKEENVFLKCNRCHNEEKCTICGMCKPCTNNKMFSFNYKTRIKQYIEVFQTKVTMEGKENTEFIYFNDDLSNINNLQSANTLFANIEKQSLNSNDNHQTINFIYNNSDYFNSFLFNILYYFYSFQTNIYRRISIKSSIVDNKKLKLEFMHFNKDEISNDDLNLSTSIKFETFLQKTLDGNYEKNVHIYNVYVLSKKLNCEKVEVFQNSVMFKIVLLLEMGDQLNVSETSSSLSKHANIKFIEQIPSILNQSGYSNFSKLYKSFSYDSMIFRTSKKVSMKSDDSISKPFSKKSGLSNEDIIFHGSKKPSILSQDDNSNFIYDVNDERSYIANNSRLERSFNIKQLNKKSSQKGMTKRKNTVTRYLYKSSPNAIAKNNDYLVFDKKKLIYEHDSQSDENSERNCSDLNIKYNDLNDQTKTASEMIKMIAMKKDKLFTEENKRNTNNGLNLDNPNESDKLNSYQIEESPHFATSIKGSNNINLNGIFNLQSPIPNPQSPPGSERRIPFSKSDKSIQFSLKEETIQKISRDLTESGIFIINEKEENSIILQKYNDTNNSGFLSVNPQFINSVGNISESKFKTLPLDIGYDIPRIDHIDRPTKNVLIIDDERLIRNTLKKFFGRLSNQNNFEFVISESEDPLEALGIINSCKKTNQTFDIIIIDENMPYFSGSDFLNLIKIIKKNGYFKKLTMISYTSYTDEFKKHLILKSGADFIINKPVYFDEFKNLINKITHVS